MPYDNQIENSMQPQGGPTMPIEAAPVQGQEPMMPMGGAPVQGQEPMMPIEGMPQPPQEEQMIQPNTSPISEGNPYFLGDHALVRFSSGEDSGSDIYWLVDKEDRTVRPFESDMALDAAFGEDLPTALQNAVTLTPPITDPDGNITEGVLAEFSLLGPEYAIKEDGTSKPLDFSSHQLKSRYGKSIDEKSEGMSTEVIDGFLEKLKKNEDKTSIPASFINKLKNNSRLMAFYVSAMAYGDYTLSDIYSDITQRFQESK